MDFFTNIWISVSEFLMGVLPLSPFTDVINSLEDLPFLGYLNWFIPVGTCLQIFEYWLIAYAAYLVYSIILRWVKVIGE